MGSGSSSLGEFLEGQNDWETIEFPISIVDSDGGFGAPPAPDELTKEGRQYIAYNFPTQAQIWEADWNHDGKVNTLDFLPSLNGWTASHCRVDLNLDGQGNTLGLLEFLTQWVTVCP